MKIIILFFSFVMAAEPKDAAKISKLDYIALQMNVLLIQTQTEDKPRCFPFGESAVNCIGFPKNKIGEKLYKDILTDEFNKLVKQQSVKGKVKLLFPELEP